MHTFEMAQLLFSNICLVVIEDFSWNLSCCSVDLCPHDCENKLGNLWSCLPDILVLLV